MRRCVAYIVPVFVLSSALSLTLSSAPSLALDAQGPATQTTPGFPSPTDSPSPATLAETATSRWGASRVFHARYSSSITPVPLIRLHSWTLHVTDASAKPVTGAEIAIVGGMPEHTHGFPTIPEVHELEGGDYRVDGLKFHMPGKWTVVLSIRLPNGTRDTVRFDVEVR